MSDLPDRHRPVAFEDTVLSEGDALAVWSRAAQLQVDEETAHSDSASSPASSSQAASSGRATTAPAQSAADPVAVAEGTRAPAGMYLVREVLAAARDAGIAEVHVRVALAEHVAMGRDLARAVESIREDVRGHLIGVDARSVRAQRVIPETPSTVLERLRTAAAAAPWSLEFDTLIGDHPAHGGVLRFAVPVIGARRDASTPPRSLSGFVYHASRVGMVHVHVTVAPSGTEAMPGSEVTITGDLRSGERRSIGIYRALTKLVAGVFAVTGAVVGAKAGGAAGAAAGLAIGSVGAIGYNALIAAVARWEHRKAHRVLTGELDALLRRIHRPSDEARAFGARPAGAETTPTLPAPRIVLGRGDSGRSLRATLLPV